MITASRCTLTVLDLDQVDFEPLTPARFPDFEALFLEERGELPPDENLAGGGCSCMEFRCSISQYHQGQGEPNRQAMRAIVYSGIVPGLIAYLDNRPIAWCSIGPRSDLPGLDERPQLAAIDDESVWSAVCFFVSHQFRRSGMMGALVEAALSFAREQGAKIVEAYPREIADIGMLATGFQGSVSTLRRAGFVEVAHRARNQVIMRCEL